MYRKCWERPGGVMVVMLALMMMYALFVQLYHGKIKFYFNELMIMYVLY
jgi:hypothetical protein